MGYINYMIVLLALYIIRDFGLQKGVGNLLQYSCTRIGTIMSQTVRNEMVPHQNEYRDSKEPSRTNEIFCA